jgi:SnoaL-like polyketide cyclase
VSDPLVSVVRRWAVDWLNRADPSVCSEIMTPDYGILIGGFHLDGRDAYVAGTVNQLNRFPGLGMTVHELISSGDRLALRFTEHGAAQKLDWREAAWGGVALFRWDGRRLTECFAEEDYYSRRRQLASGQTDPIEPPATAPWNATAQDPDPAAEEVVHGWLARGDLSSVELDDGWLGHDVALQLEDVTVELNELFSAGAKVAFHGVCRGRYVGGLDAVDAATGQPVSLHVAGVVTVAEGEVATGRVIRDRLGLQRSLSEAVRS